MPIMHVDPELCIEVPADFDDEDAESQVHPTARRMFFAATQAEAFGKAHEWVGAHNIHVLDAAWNQMLDEEHPYVLTIYFTFEFDDEDDPPLKIPRTTPRF